MDINEKRRFFSTELFRDFNLPAKIQFVIGIEDANKKGLRVSRLQKLLKGYSVEFSEVLFRESIVKLKKDWKILGNYNGHYFINLNGKNYEYVESFLEDYMSIAIQRNLFVR